MNIETADRLIALRRRKGLSQEQLAEALGISRQAVSKWERAESSPDVDNAIQLSRLYDISLDELFGNKPEYEIELDSMEPDSPEEAHDEPETAPEHEVFPSDSGVTEAAAAFAASLSSSISEIVHDAAASAKEAAAEAKSISAEARKAGLSDRELAIPDRAAPILDMSTYEGIRRLACTLRADLCITGTESGVCTVRCEGPEKEKARCCVYTEGETLHIESEDAQKKLFFGLQGRVKLRIYVELPSALGVEAALKGGDLTFNGVRCELVNARTGGGDIAINGGSFGELGLKTGGGDIEIDSADAQRAELVTGGGEITTKGLNAAALLCARTGGGDIKAEGSAKCLEATTGGGDISLNFTAEGINAKTGGGDIRVRCRGMKYVSAKTGGGDIDAQLYGCAGVTADLASAGGEANINYKNEKQSSGRKLMFTAGDGSAVLEMRSGGGDIRVKAE